MGAGGLLAASRLAGEGRFVFEVRVTRADGSRVAIPAKPAPAAPAAKGQCVKSAPRGMPVVRDDGRRYGSLSSALRAAGYASTGGRAAHDRIGAGKAWRDGHVYGWARGEAAGAGEG